MQSHTCPYVIALKINLLFNTLLKRNVQALFSVEFILLYVKYLTIKSLQLININQENRPKRHLSVWGGHFLNLFFIGRSCKDIHCLCLFVFHLLGQKCVLISIHKLFLLSLQNSSHGVILFLVHLISVELHSCM